MARLLGPESSGWIQEEGPVDISALPVIRAAQRRHHRLIRHHGQAAATTAVLTAVHAWQRGEDRLGRRQWERIDILRPGTERVSSNDPITHAVCYPDIITIASVLASPFWQNTATDPRTETTAVAEILRRIHEREMPDPYDNTGATIWPVIRDWARGLQRDRRHRDPDRYWDEVLAKLL